MTDADIAAAIRPAPKQLALLAAEMRGWDYEDIRAALIACSEAHWPDERIYRETFALLLDENGRPADLRIAAARPTLGPPTGPEVNARGKELVLEAIREARHEDDPDEAEAS